MAQPDHGAAPRRAARARRRSLVLLSAVVVLVIGFVAMVVGTLTSTAWLAIAAPIVMMCGGIGGIALYMNEP
jgi:hypothetical protein